ncbi:GAF and ANTAR domain-containing protein [Nocardioides sp. CFH 31398]|uniref:GAF and ANTAR domain-containing protein n=1 Tax=Nocardioides sp. CFH 31398 TaxID=2919579 RepID=UPI001F06961F|nr:GAF and ANTAR domain-containing protein [Nocardioides sp. CFH 31398]MCH1868736.1 GAF and ANTAR domain-containing protein [Nocardioides sp. CFH 31398]
MEHDAAAFAQLAREMQSQSEEPLTAATIIRLATSNLPDVDHASLTVRLRGGRYRSLGASNEAVEQADAAQHELKEGPCVDAIDEDEWFLSTDLEKDERWPRWGPRAAELGFGSLLSFPLVQGKEPTASINLYADEAGRFTGSEAVTQAALFSVHAATALASAHEISGLQTAITSRHLIGMAQGVLMERHGLTAAQSFSFLQRLSSTTNVKLREVAEQVLDGSLGVTDRSSDDDDDAQPAPA